jgi:hypothetical protein
MHLDSMGELVPIFRDHGRRCRRKPAIAESRSSRAVLTPGWPTGSESRIHAPPLPLLGLLPRDPSAPTLSRMPARAPEAKACPVEDSRVIPHRTSRAHPATGRVANAVGA